jgi:hypothetical protein
MAEIEIACPSCGDKRRVSDDLAGKKIKCKKCQGVFTVKAPPPAAPAGSPKPAAKPGAQPAPAKPAARAVRPVKAKEEEEENADPYTMREENLSVGCPFCAQLMEPPDAKICLHCGYDMQKRRRVESKQVYEQTGADYFIYHLSTIGCFVGIVVLVGLNVFCLLNMRGWVGGTDIAEVMGPDCFSTWLVIFSCFPIFFAARFIFRRLAYRFTPPEKEVKKGNEFDEE